MCCQGASDRRPKNRSDPTKDYQMKDVSYVEFNPKSLCFAFTCVIHWQGLGSPACGCAVCVLRKLGRNSWGYMLFKIDRIY